VRRAHAHARSRLRDCIFLCSQSDKFHGRMLRSIQSYVDSLFVSFVRRYSLLGEELKWICWREKLSNDELRHQIFRYDYDLDVIEKYSSAKREERPISIISLHCFVSVKRETWNVDIECLVRAQEKFWRFVWAPQRFFLSWSCRKRSAFKFFPASRFDVTREI